MATRRLSDPITIGLIGGVALVGAALVGAAAGWVAAGAPSPAAALVLLVAPAVALAIVLYPRPGTALLAALVMANAGLVLQEQASLPNIEKGVTLLVAIGVLFDRRALEVVRAVPWLYGVLGIFAASRLFTALTVPGSTSPVDVAQEMMFAVLLVFVLSWAIARCGALIWVLLGISIAGGIASLLAFARLVVGIDSTFFGFAPEPLFTTEQLAAIQRGGIVPDETRASGPIADPNFYAQTLALAIPLAIWVALRGPRLSVRLAGGASALAMTGGLLLTQSRGGFIALFLALFVLGALELRGRWRMLLLALPIVVAIGISVSGATERVEQLTEITNPRETTDPSIRGRVSEQIVSLKMLADEPITGIGVDQYLNRYQEYALEVGLDERPVREPHSAYLGIAAETGIPGLAAFIALFVVGLVVAWRARSRFAAMGRPERGAAAAVAAGLTGYAVAALFLHLAFPAYLWLALGLVGGVGALAQRQESQADEPAPTDDWQATPAESRA